MEQKHTSISRAQVTVVGLGDEVHPKQNREVKGFWEVQRERGSWAMGEDSTHLMG